MLHGRALIFHRTGLVVLKSPLRYKRRAAGVAAGSFSLGAVAHVLCYRQANDPAIQIGRGLQVISMGSPQYCRRVGVVFVNILWQRTGCAALKSEGPPVTHSCTTAID